MRHVTTYFRHMTDLQPYAIPSALPQTESGRVAQLLSLPTGESFGDVELAARVAEGLPADAVSHLEALVGASGVLVPEATLRRARSAGKPLSRQHSERVYEISLVVDALARSYRGDRTRIHAFLHRAHPLLGGMSPFDMARSSSAGARLVLKVIERANAGVAV